MINRIKLTENFWLDEFQCRCCHQVKIEPELLEKLQKLRDWAKDSITLNSAFRCVKHNRDIGGVSNSFHVQGKAVDINMKGHTKEHLHAMHLQAQVLGFTGIGLYYSKKDGSPIFMHLDVGTERFRQWDEVR